MLNKTNPIAKYCRLIWDVHYTKFCTIIHIIIVPPQCFVSAIHMHRFKSPPACLGKDGELISFVLAFINQP